MVIKMENVMCIRDNNVILKNINWEVRQNEHWAIVGLNGSGKTTLLNIINGYIFPSKGDVTVLGKQFGRYDLRELRKSIGWVSTSLQERLYTNDTSEKIVLSGKFASIGLYDQPTQEDIKKAHSLLEQLGCASLIKRSYKTLSQGEKQKVLIARALINSPKLLILDEPCTGLDMFAREQLLKTIEQLPVQKDAPTILYVTHRIEEILPVFTHTLLLRRGEIYAQGKTDDVLNKANLAGFFETPIELQEKDNRRWMQIL
ncbi:MAG: ABC transporter ATP-binding protein [Bacillota bacterium]|nr:ABC transporter ATP-binding protein [Bacillota bacterium]MDW7684756.1 ABC transporter ATP-binding protein [Bacillota bacterium]